MRKIGKVKDYLEDENVIYSSRNILRENNSIFSQELPRIEVSDLQFESEKYMSQTSIAFRRRR